MKFTGYNFNVLEKGRALVEVYRNDPVLAARHLLGVDLPSVQRIVLRNMFSKKFIVSVQGRGTGKTFVGALYAALKGMLYPGSRIGLIGPTFRQSKYIFEKVEEFYYLSSIFREACVGPPKRLSDQCVVHFKPVGGRPGSLIMSLPIGDDGSTVRGARFYDLIVDEFAQVPEEIFNAVILPFQATTANPMEEVRRRERIRRLTELGYEIPSTDCSVNQLIILSSAFYEFNHLYKRFMDYKERHIAGDNRYIAFQVPYTFMPDGFINDDMVDNARMTASEAQFAMEYLAEFRKDSDGYFRASLIEEHTLHRSTVELDSYPDAKYIISCDPGRNDNSTGIIIIRVGYGDGPSKVVNAIELDHSKKEVSFPDQALLLADLVNHYGNVIKIAIDKQGGGSSIADNLRLGNVGDKSFEPILEDTEEFKHLSGKHILELVEPSFKWIADANHHAVNIIEKDMLKFPGPPLTGSELKERSYETIKRMIDQLLSIEVTATRAGHLHFDLPRSAINKKKDLYSAFVLAADALYNYKYAPMEYKPSILTHGIIRPRASKSLAGGISNLGKTARSGIRVGSV